MTPSDMTPEEQRADLIAEQNAAVAAVRNGQATR